MTVYLDHNATTPLRPEVKELLAELLEHPPANASSLHASGRAARHLIDDARVRVAGALGVGEGEVIFTSGGTEAVNLALVGVLTAAGSGSRLVTTSIEHSAVLETAQALSGDMSGLLEGHREVERILDERRATGVFKIVGG